METQGRVRLIESVKELFEKRVKLEVQKVERGKQLCKGEGAREDGLEEDREYKERL